MRILAAALAAGLALLASAQAQENWPQRQVTVVVPFGAGGSTDLIARILTGHMQTRFGVPVVVENRAGAGGSIGAAVVAKAAPDTLLVGSVSSNAINAFLYTRLILELPEVAKALKDLGAEPAPSTPEQFAEFTRSERARWQEVVKASGVRID